ncbi:hypothetical protein BG003_010642, partial [Podila horticola]
MKTLSYILVCAAALAGTQSAPTEYHPPQEESNPSHEQSIQGTYQYSDDHSSHPFTVKNGECHSLSKPGHISRVEVKGVNYKCYGYSDYNCHNPVQLRLIARKDLDDHVDDQLDSPLD